MTTVPVLEQLGPAQAVGGVAEQAVIARAAEHLVAAGVTEADEALRSATRCS
jgi:hypothetical protein